MNGKMIINGKDAYAEYGILLYESGSGLNENYSQLLTPPPAKTHTMVSYREKPGEEVNVASVVFEARSVTLQLLLIANSESQWWTRYNAFIALIKTGWLTIEIPELKKTYRMYYESTSQYKQLTTMKQARVCARFSIKLREPKPNF